MSDPKAPELRRPDYGGELWPSAPSEDEPSEAAQPPDGEEQETPHRSRSRLGPPFVILILGIAVFAFALGLAAAGPMAGEISTAGDLVEYERGQEAGFEAGQEAGYEEGFTKGQARGLRAGRKSGYEKGFRKGKAVGRDAGYKDGYAAGRGVGYRSGLIDGCEAVFDELDTNRVIDRPAGPFQRYWYLKKDQCQGAGTWS